MFKIIFYMTLGLCASFVAHAQSNNLNNTATVSTACRVSTTNLVFGSYNPLDTAIPLVSATITAVCTPGSFTIRLNGGSNSTAYKMAGDTYNYTRCQRAMKSTRGDFVAYDLRWIDSYDPATANSSNPVMTTETCPNTFATSISASFTPQSGSVWRYNIWGAIRNYPADRSERSAYVDGRKARPGVYTDTVIVQMTY